MHNRHIPELAVMLIACFAFVLGGCRVGVPARARNTTRTTTMGSHKVTICPGASYTSSSSSTGNGHERRKFTCGAVTIVIEDENLSVNGQSYGALNKGDSVRVDHGVVYVQDKKVDPEPGPGKQLPDPRPDPPETTYQVGDYPVTVRPGSVSMSLVGAMGKDKLTSGATIVVIDGDKLTVNDASYGKLKPGDTVLVDHGKVSISGQPRQAE